MSKATHTVDRWSLTCLRMISLVAWSLLAVLLGGAGSASAACPNEAFRTGASANLPDCRAYELMTPLGVRAIFGIESAGPGYNFFPTHLASVDGDKAIFALKTGALLEPPGGNGSDDLYETERTAAGWTVTRRLSPSGNESREPTLGGVSSDLGYALITAVPGRSGEITGTLGENGTASYLGKPNGSFEPLGIGRLGSEVVVEPEVQGRYISEGGTHVIFTTGGFWCSEEALCQKRQLQPNAPPTGTAAIYDRGASGPTKVVSLLPNDVTPGAGEDAEYEGVSKDASTVAFKVSGVTYARVENATTRKVASNDAFTVGASLSCDTTAGAATNSFQWLRDGAPIGGATGATYTTSGTDAGKVIQCQVTSASAEGGSRATSTPANVAPTPSPSPPKPEFINVNGTPTVGQTLACEAGIWTGSPTFGYQWLRNGSPIAGATESTYLLASPDAGTAIQCEVSGTNAGGTAIADSFNTPVAASTPSATANPSISGTPSVGETLSCDEGSWANGPTFTYEWLRNGAAIGGQTAQTHTVVAEDEGATVQCRVTASNANGVTQAVAERVVVPPAPVATPPSLTTPGAVGGSPSVGGFLFCDPGTWTEEPGFEFQWLRNGVPIAGATESFYVPTTEDRGRTLQCMVTASNAGGKVVAINAGAEGARYVFPELPASTASVPTATVTFAGLSDNGEFMFYVQDGNVFRFDTRTGARTLVTEAGDAELVNVSADGSHAYFLSQKVLAGAAAQAGQPNLYAWTLERPLAYVGTVSPLDLAAETGNSFESETPALNRWTSNAVSANREEGAGPGGESSRTTPTGRFLVFESHAQLTPYANNGFTEIYRYDAETGSVLCVSCNSNGQPPIANARLQAVKQMNIPFGGQAMVVDNITVNGERVFFETTESLAPRDVDGVNDIYEWQTNGSGPPVINLISSGHSLFHASSEFPEAAVQEPNILFSISPDGSNVIFRTGDQLVAQAGEGGEEALYDARIGGGFPQPAKDPCESQICETAGSGPPNLGGAASSALRGAGNVKTHRKPCKAGKRGKKGKHKRPSCHRRKRHHHGQNGHHHKKGAAK